MAANDNERNFAEEILADVRQQIAADDDVLREARERRSHVTRIARKFPGALRSFSSGSLAHGTVNRPVTDADAGVVLDRRCYADLGPDGEGVGPVDIVDEVMDFIVDELVDDYPNVTAEVTKRAILFEFDEPVTEEEDPSVDLVVGLTRKDEDGLWIPNTERDDWDASDPEEHTNLLTGGSALDVHRARVIRLGKALIKQDDEHAVLSSFNLEALALEHVTSVEKISESLRDLLAGAAAGIAEGDTPDPAGVSAPIKLPDGIDRARAVKRLDFFRDRLVDAVENSDDEYAARTALAEAFFKYVDPPAPTAKRAIADELRRGNPKKATAAIFGAGTSSLKSTSSFGDARPA